MSIDDDNKVSLKEHILKLMDEHDKQHELIAQALEKANEGLTQKQKDANEWRATIGDFRDKTISRKEFDEYKNGQGLRIGIIERSKAKIDGGLAVVIFIISVVASLIISFIFK